jgi:hypothetical protein
MTSYPLAQRARVVRRPNRHEHKPRSRDHSNRTRRTHLYAAARVRFGRQHSARERKTWLLTPNASNPRKGVVLVVTQTRDRVRNNARRAQQLRSFRFHTRKRRNKPAHRNQNERAQTTTDRQTTQRTATATCDARSWTADAI